MSVFHSSQEVPGYMPTLISGASADTTIKAKRGVLHRIVVHVAGAASSTITVYDGAITGTAKFVLPMTATINNEYNMQFQNSCHIVTVDSGGNGRVLVLAK